MTSAHSAHAIAGQVWVIAVLLAAASITTLVVFILHSLSPSRRSPPRSKLASAPNSPQQRLAPFFDPEDVDHQKVYLLAPTPGQKWTSHYSHPTSALSPSFHTSTDADESRLADLLTPSKDWWTGHKAGTSRTVARGQVMPKLDFGDAEVDQHETYEETTTTTTTTTSRRSRASNGRASNSAKKTSNSSRTSRRSRNAEPEEQPAAAAAESSPEPVTRKKQQQQEEEQPGAPEAAAAAVDPDQYEFQGGRGGDDDDDNDAAPSRYDRALTPEPRLEASPEYPASPMSPFSPTSFGTGEESTDETPAPPSSSRRKSGTPGRHRRVWTHTVVPGVEEARIHRKGGMRL